MQQQPARSFLCAAQLLHLDAQAVKVNSLGKWKTALQMTSMSLLLFCKDGTGRIERLFGGERARWRLQLGGSLARRCALLDAHASCTA